MKTNICPKSEALKANMLVLRTTKRNYQAFSSEDCLYCSPLNFLPRQFESHIESFPTFLDERRDRKKKENRKKITLSRQVINFNQ